jgi:hypothetical protein
MDVNDIRKRVPALAGLDDQTLMDTVHRQYFSDVSPDQFYKQFNYQPKQASPEGTSGLRWAGDMGIKTAQGIVDLGSSAVGLGSLVTGGLLGKGMRAIGYDPQRTNEMLGEYLSDAQKAADKKVAEADGFFDTIGQSIANPRSILGGIAQSAPGMLGAMGITRAVAGKLAANAALATAEGRAASQAAMAAGNSGENAIAAALNTAAGKEAAEKALEASATRLLATGAATEGAQTAGQIADDAQAKGRDYTDYVLPAVAAGVGTGLIGLGAGKLMGDAATSIATGSKAAGVKGNLAQKIGKEFLSEGVLEEMPQSAQEQFFTNMAQGNDNLMDGVANAAGSGLIVGGVQGAAMGGGQDAMRHLANRQKLKDTGPLSRASNAIADQADSVVKAPALGYAPDPLISFKDGTVARQSEIDSIISRLPTERERMAYRAKILGYAPEKADTPTPDKAPPALLEYAPEPLVAAKDGTIAPKADIDNLVNKLPDERARMEARAKLLGYGAQKADPAPTQEELQKISDTNRINHSLSHPRNWSLEDAQAMNDIARSQGRDLYVVPHLNEGYTLLPKKWLSPQDIQEFAPLQLNPDAPKSIHVKMTDALQDDQTRNAKISAAINLEKNQLDVPEEYQNILSEARKTADDRTLLQGANSFAKASEAFQQAANTGKKEIFDPFRAMYPNTAAVLDQHLSENPVVPEQAPSVSPEALGDSTEAMGVSAETTVEENSLDNSVDESLLHDLIADTDARVVGSDKQRAEARRAEVLDSVLSSDNAPTRTVASLAREFSKRLSEIGVKQTKATDAELQRLKKFADVSAAALTDPVEQDNLSGLVKERDKGAQPVKDKASQLDAVDRAIAQGMRLRTEAGSVLMKKGSPKIFRLNDVQKAHYLKQIAAQGSGAAMPAPVAQNAPEVQPAIEPAPPAATPAAQPQEAPVTAAQDPVAPVAKAPADDLKARFSGALEDQLRLLRLNMAKAKTKARSAATAEEKLKFLDKAEQNEKALRQARQQIFNAEDTFARTIESGNNAEFEQYRSIYPKAAAILDQHFAGKHENVPDPIEQPKESEAPQSEQYRNYITHIDRFNDEGRKLSSHERELILSDSRITESEYQDLVKRLDENTRLSDIHDQAHEAATSHLNDKPEPTPAQAEAGNYKKGHIQLHGLDITVENPKGSTRSGTDETGKRWESTMQHHYGYIKGTVGADGDHIDTFVGPHPNSDKVFVVDQVNPRTGAFDEHKVMLGFNSMDEARAGYLANYEQGWTGGRDMVETNLSTFKSWLENGNKQKPFYAAKKERAPRKPKEQVRKPQEAEKAPEAPAVEPWQQTDSDLMNALAHLSDVISDAFGAKLNITGPRYTHGDILPAMAKVMEQMIIRGARSLKDAVTQVSNLMTTVPALNQHVNKLSVRQWKAAYNAVAEYHAGTESEEAVSKVSADEVLAIVRGATVRTGKVSKPTPDAAELAEKAKSNKAAPKKSGKQVSGTLMLRDDFGTDAINGYESTADFRVDPDNESGTQGVKVAFIKDAKAYLSDVATQLEEYGFSSYADKKGRPQKPVSVNEGGIAVSGDISLTMFNETMGNGIYVNITEGASIPIIPQTKSGVTVMARVTEADQPYGGGRNLWLPVDLTSGDLAKRLHDEVSRISERTRPKEEEVAPPVKQDAESTKSEQGSLFDDAVEKQEDDTALLPYRDQAAVAGLADPLMRQLEQVYHSNDADMFVSELNKELAKALNKLTVNNMTDAQLMLADQLIAGGNALLQKRADSVQKQMQKRGLDTGAANTDAYHDQPAEQPQPVRALSDVIVAISDYEDGNLIRLTLPANQAFNRVDSRIDTLKQLIKCMVS